MGVIIFVTKIVLAPHVTLLLMIQLSRSSLRHDDPNSLTHKRDKTAKKQRDMVDYVSVPSPVFDFGRKLTGVEFNPDSSGFMIEFGDSVANAASAEGLKRVPAPCRVPADSYRRRILKEEKLRRRFRRTISRGEKSIETWGQHREGGVSLVATVPPWTMSLLNTLEDDIRDQMLMNASHAAALKMAKVSGRVPWGAGVHLDTDICHFHFQIPKTSPKGKNWEKSKFRTGGPWLTGADRISRNFPNLLGEKQTALLKKRKEEKGVLVDLEIAKAIEESLEMQFLNLHLSAEYERSKREYRHRKIKSQDTERQRQLLKSALKYFTIEGIWPLAATSMKLGIWRMIPREIRPLVMTSIRVMQMIVKPSPAALVKSTAREIVMKLASTTKEVNRPGNIG